MRRTLTVALAAGLALASVACHGKSSAAPSTKPAVSKGGTSTAPSAVPTGPPGSYSYGSYGLTAEMTYNDDGSTYDLKVTNKTGSTGKPGIYALDARTGKRIEATVSPDEAVQDGQTKDYTVTMGTGFDSKQIGLMILLLGGKNFGAFVANASSSG